VTALLDVNVLVALAWPNHVFHEQARARMKNRGARGWATTPITELGFVRISSNKKIIPNAVGPQFALGVLGKLCRKPGHEFWPDHCRLLETQLSLDRLGSYRQVTDIHLAALATERGGVLVTFDRGAREALAPDDRDAVKLLGEA
jgi:toxin-antitoxin system PIN domain toxin